MTIEIPSVRVAIWFAVTLFWLIDFVLRITGASRPELWATIAYFLFLYSGLRFAYALHDHLRQYEWGEWNMPPYDWDHDHGLA